MSFAGGSEGAADEVPEEPRCPNARADLYKRGRRLLLGAWQCTQCEDGRPGQLGGPLNTFLDRVDGCDPPWMVHLIVSGTLGAKDRWTAEHTAALEAGLPDNNAAVVIVDGAVDKEAFKGNIRSDGRVHVIEALALANVSFEGLPRIVDAGSVCEAEGLSAATELPRVKSSAPEVQLLRAKENDILAYAPTPDRDELSPSGQVTDWVARIVVP